MSEHDDRGLDQPKRSVALPTPTEGGRAQAEFGPGKLTGTDRSALGYRTAAKPGGGTLVEQQYGRPPASTPTEPELVAVVMYDLEQARAQIQQLADANQKRHELLSWRCAGNVREHLNHARRTAELAKTRGEDTRSADTSLEMVEMEAAPHLAASFQPPSGTSPFWSSPQYVSARSRWRAEGGASEGHTQPLREDERGAAETTTATDASGVRGLAEPGREVPRKETHRGADHEGQHAKPSAATAVVTESARKDAHHPAHQDTKQSADPAAPKQAALEPAAAPKLDERDYRGPQTAAAYFAWNQVHMLAAIRNRVGTASLPAPHQRLVWSDASAFASAFEHALIATSGTGMALAHRLPELLYPADPFALIDQHRDLDEGRPGEDGKVARGSREWNPVVGQAIAVEVDACLRRSLPRMGLRYVTQADDYHGSVNSDMLVASSPFDIVVARLVSDARVATFVPDKRATKGKRGPKDTDARAAFKNGIRLVSVEWMGAHDPKLWNYVRVLDCPDATPEEVSATLFERGDSKNHTEYAYGLIVSSPFVRVPPKWARNMPGAKEYAPAKEDETSAEASSALDLADSSVAEEAARSQAGKPAAKLDMNGLAHTLANSEAQLRFIGDQLGDWKLAHLVGPALRRVAKQKEALLATPTETLKSWAAVADAQATILVEVTGEIVEVLQVATGARIEPGSAEAEPFREIVEAFGIAMGESHLSQTAMAQLVVAKQKKAMLPLVLQSRALRENHDVAQQMATDKPKPISARESDPATTAKATNRTLESTLLDMKARAMSGDMPSASELQDAQVATAQATLENRIVMLYDRVGDYEAAVSASDEGFAKVTNVALEPLPDPEKMAKAGRFSTADYQALAAKLRAVQGRAAVIRSKMLADLIPKALPADPDAARTAIAAARKDAVARAQAELERLAADPDLEKMFNRAVQLIEDARINQMIVDIALMIGISVVGGLAGSWVGGLVRGAALAGAAADTVAFARTVSTARWLGGAANVVTDAGIQAIGQTAVFGGNTGLSLGENLVASILTIGALRPIHTLAGELGALDDQAMGMWKGLSKGRVAFVHAGTFTAEMLAGAGASYVAARMVHGKPKNDEEATAWGMQGAAMAVGHFINRRLGPLNQRLSKLGEHGAHLRKRATAQQALATKLEHSGDTEQALRLLDEHTQILKDEQALLSDPAFIQRAGLDAAQVDALRTGNSEALADTDSQAYDTMELRFHGLEPIANNGMVWAGARASIERVIAEGGVAVKSVHEDRAPRYWETEMGGRAVRFVETDATDLRTADARATGVAGPDLHTHVMGVTDVSYFVDKLGNGKASAAFDAVYEALASNKNAQEKAAHGWSIAQAARADIERMRGTGTKPSQIEARAHQAMTEMLAAGPTTPFDRTYPVREAVIERHIDPGDGPFRNYTRDTMMALAEEGVGYSEQSVGMGKLAEKFPEEMMKELHAELAKQGKDVDMRFLAMVTTRALGGKVDPKNAKATIQQLDSMLARGDVIGIDFAGPEKQVFTADGMENFKELYAVVSAAAKKRKRSLVVRPHVGEGYNEGKGQTHVEMARKNLETIISTLELMGYSASKANVEADGVIVRFGHASHATPSQIERMARLGVIVEANIGSNEITGSIAKAEEHPLLYNLYYEVGTVAGTDAQGVMRTDRRQEYARARRQIERFKANEFALKLADDRQVYFRDLSTAEKRRFSIRALENSEDAYHGKVAAGDRRDTARH